MSAVSKPNYGIDAPGVIRNFILIGFICLLAAVFAPHPAFGLGPISIVTNSFYWPAGFCIGEGLLMLLYSLHGKFNHRDRMLALVAWKGTEQVMDVGTGRGLLLVGAAKRLTTGHATGIDIWSTTDLSGNAAAATQHNLALEGVADRCTLVSAPAQSMDFPDGTFDVIVSNLCLHNIKDRATRDQALQQIARVLRSGGAAVISDYIHTSQYAKVFRELGLTVDRKRPNYLTTFPPLSILHIRKP